MATVKKKVSKRRLRQWLVSYAFLIPALIFFSMFVVYPMIVGIQMSFSNANIANLTKGFDFVWFENYKTLYHDKAFHKSMINTILIVLVAVPIIIIFSIFVSMNIYKKSEFMRSLFRTIFYLPAVTSVVSVTVVWGWIYHPNYGVLNYLTNLLGFEPVSWLGDTRTALMAITVIMITSSVGQPIVLYVASLGNIPKSYIEAAELEGATPWQVFRNITWPLLMPTNLYVIVITTINSFQIFALIQLLTSGGPMYATSTVMYSVYEQAFHFGNFGLASSMGVVLSVVIGAIAIVQFKFFGSDVEY